MRFTVIDEGRASEVEARVDGDAVRLSDAALRDGLGWEVKPEGLCKGGLCVPVRDRAALVHADGVDLAALAGILGRPLALDTAARAAFLGASAGERGAQLASGMAPDVTLPDLDGRPHALAGFRGKKVLLIAYASW